MKTSIVRIGNSRGIRLPKSVLEQCHLKDTVELEVKDNMVIIRTAHLPRSGWADAFASMTQHGDDKMLDEDAGSPTEWDQAEWRW